MHRLGIALGLLAATLVLAAPPGRGEPLTPHKLTKIFLGSKFYGSITRVNETHNNVSWRMSRRISACAVFPDLYLHSGRIRWESEGNTYSTARRRSSRRWDVHGDPEGPLAGGLIGWAWQRRPGQWEIYGRVGLSKRFRWRGYASGPDGGAAGVALLQCVP